MLFISLKFCGKWRWGCENGGCGGEDEGEVVDLEVQVGSQAKEDEIRNDGSDTTPPDGALRDHERPRYCPSSANYRTLPPPPVPPVHPHPLQQHISQQSINKCANSQRHDIDRRIRIEIIQLQDLFPRRDCAFTIR